MTQAMNATSFYWLNVPMYSDSWVQAACAKATADERARIRQELVTVVIANAGNNDTLLGTLLDAIRELAS
jgi:hypothetical protein